ncbi:MAG: hypothetical protein ACRDKG_02820 [Actinomycetota bacterium]
MPLLDQLAAVAMLGATGGVVAWRAWRAWRDFRVQRRALEILIRSVVDLEQRERKTTTS